MIPRSQTVHGAVHHIHIHPLQRSPPFPCTPSLLTPHPHPSHPSLQPLATDPEPRPSANVALDTGPTLDVTKSRFRDAEISTADVWGRLAVRLQNGGGGVI